MNLRLKIVVPTLSCLLLGYLILVHVRLLFLDTTLFDSNPTMPLTVVAPTFYSTVDDTRYKLGLEACQNAARYNIRLLLVDASPSDDVRDGLRAAGRGYVQVMKQTSSGRKGAALREAIQWATKDDTNDAPMIIGFQELEKVDMFRHWGPLVQHMVETSADIGVPRRMDNSFRAGYPIEQYHCESFANLYLDSLSRDVGLVSIDWTMGPVAFRNSLANYWIEFEGDMWDAQLVPLVHAFQAGAKVTSFSVDYLHPKSMKEQEEGVAEWNEKRLHQLNFLKMTVGKALADDSTNQKAVE